MVTQLENVRPPQIGGTLPHDEYIKVLYSIAVSLKRIADALGPDNGENVTNLLYQIEMTLRQRP